MQADAVVLERETLDAGPLAEGLVETSAQREAAQGRQLQVTQRLLEVVAKGELPESEQHAPQRFIEVIAKSQALKGGKGFAVQRLVEIGPKAQRFQAG